MFSASVAFAESFKVCNWLLRKPNEKVTNNLALVCTALCYFFVNSAIGLLLIWLAGE